MANLAGISEVTMAQRDGTSRELTARAQAHHLAGRLDAAEQDYRAALALAPRNAPLAHNLAVVLAENGRPADALALLDDVIAIEPSYAAAHYNRGAALESLGRHADAVAAFGRTCALEPGHYDAHRALGFLRLALRERGRSLDHFARTYELRRGEDRSRLAARSLDHASRDKLVHDAAQLRYLAGRRRDSKSLLLLARAYDAVAAELPDGIVRLTPEQLDVLGDSYNTGFDVRSAPEIAGGAICDAVTDADVARRYREGGGVTTIDSVLTPAALSALRRTLLESTIWHDFGHIGGFVASYLEDGLACPLVLQIADELRAALPSLLATKPLTQAWAFKGLREQSAIDAHADDAAISVNLWLTPAEANLDPARGGLAVCRALPPPDWEVEGYDEDLGRIADFLAVHRDDTAVIPYAQNRAVLFDARLFHHSDAPRFAGAYESHRINLTLLYGRHGE